MQLPHDLYNWTIHWAATPYAVHALFFIALAESSFFPLAPDILLIPMCIAHPERAFFYALVCTIGSVMGGVVGQRIGYYGGRPIALKLFKKDLIDAAEKLYKKYDVWALGIAGFTPVPYKVFTILAGILRIKLVTLISVSLVSRGARFFLVATLLYFYGEAIHEFMQKYLGLLSMAFVVLLIGGFVSLKFFVKRKT